MDFIRGHAILVDGDTAIIEVNRDNSASSGVGYRVELCGLKIEIEESHHPVFSAFLHTAQNMRTGEMTRYAIKHDDDCIRLFWNLRKSKHAPSPRLSAALVNVLGPDAIIAAFANSNESSFAQAIKDAGIKGVGPKVIKEMLGCPKLRKMATGMSGAQKTEIASSSKPVPEVESMIRKLKDMGQPLPTTAEIRKLNSMAARGENLMFGIIKAGSVSKFLKSSGPDNQKPQDS